MSTGGLHNIMLGFTGHNVECAHEECAHEQITDTATFQTGPCVCKCVYVHRSHLAQIHIRLRVAACSH